jgi:hypothetical protein
MLEDRLVGHAQTQGAPRLPGEVAARRLGADAALLEARLRGRARHARAHRATQAQAGPGRRLARPHLTRTVEVITGPADTGKTRVLATTAQIWDGPVVGTATSQNATNELRAVGVQVAANTTRLAITADAELRRRHPDHKIEPLRSAEPTPVSGTDREQLHPAPDSTPTWIQDLTISIVRVTEGREVEPGGCDALK